jgi:membrane protease subunit HflK
MAWNEPGGGKRDPWGGGDRNGGNPPDLDEMLRKAKQKFDRFFEGGGSGDSGGSSSGRSSKGLFGLVGILLFAFWIYQGVHILDEKEGAVVLRFGQFHDTIGPGFNWKPWLIDTVYRDFVTEERQYSSSGLMLTQDENIVQVPITVQYNIGNIRDYVLNVNNPTGTLEQASDSAIRHVVGSTLLTDVLGEGREVLRDEVKRRLQNYLESYGTGINIIDVTLQRAEPPDAVRDAFDDVNAAEADKDRMIDQARAYSNGIVPVARGQAQRMIEEANAYRGQVVEQARGETVRFLRLLEEYKLAPDVTRERLYIDAMQRIYSSTSKVLVDIEGGNNLLYLPLDQMMNRQSVTPAGTQGTTMSSAGSLDTGPATTVRGGR